MKKAIKISGIFLILNLFAILIYGAVPLQKNEEIIFTFKTANSKEVSLIKDTSDKYIFYRISKNNKIEMEYPQKNNESWNKFTYSFYLRGGGIQNAGRDLNYVYFENNNFKYIIYDTYFAEDSTSSIGVKVINIKTEETKKLAGKYSTRKGTLTGLRDNNLIQKSEEVFD